MATPDPPKPPADPLLRAIVATAVAVAAGLALLALFGASKLELVQVPSFVVMVHGFMLLAALCIAFLALGRHRVTGDPVSYWTGVAFANYGILVAFYILCWPGLRTSGESLIGHLPGTAAWVLTLAQFLLDVPLLLAATSAWPGRAALPGRGWGWSVAAWLVPAALLGLLTMVCEHHLPALVDAAGRFTILEYAFVFPATLVLAAAGAVFAARAYRRTHSGLLGYVALFQVAVTFSVAATALAVHRYSLPWYLSRVVGLGGFLTVLLGLMWEYVGLYRREQDNSRELAQRGALLESMIEHAPAGLALYDGHSQAVLWHNQAYNMLLDARWHGADLVGRTLFELVPGSEELGVGDIHRAAAVGQAYVHPEFEFAGFERGITYYNWTLTPQPHPDRDGFDVLTMAVDITEQVLARRRVEELAHETQVQNEALLEAERQAQGRAAELDAVFDAMAEGVVIWGPDRTPVRMNPAAEAALKCGEAQPDLPPEQQPAELQWRLPSGAPLPSDLVPLHRAFGGETVPEWTLLGRAADGTNQWYLASAIPMRDAEGSVRGAVTTFTDITTTIRLGCEFEKRAAEYGAVLSAIGDGVAVYGLDGSMLSINEAGARILGTPRETLLQPWERRRRAVDLRLPSGKPVTADIAPSSRALRGETVEGMLLRATRGDGREVWLSVTGAPVRDVSGAITSAVLTYSDITALMEAQQAAQQLAAERDAVRASIGDGVSVYALDGTMLSVNAAGARILGLPPEALLCSWDERRRALELRLPSGEPVTRDTAPSFRAFRGETTENALIQARRGDGREIWLSLTAAPVRDASGNVTCAVVTYSDITPLMEAQAQRDAVIATQERETAVLHLINEAADAKALVREAGVLLRDWFGCDAVGLRWRRGEDYPYLESDGFPEDFVLKENSLCECDDCGELIRDEAGLPALECMCGNILRGRTDPALPFFSPGGSFWSNNTTRLLATTTDADPHAKTRNRCNGEGYESVALIPLRFGDTIFGLLQLNGQRPDCFTAEGIEFLERIAGSLAVRLAEQEAQAEARRRADALAESEERYRTLGELMPFGVWMTSTNRMEHYVSQSLLDLVGQDRQTWSDTVFASLIHPDDLAACEAVYHEIEAADLNTPWSQEFRLRAADGHWHWVLARGIKVADAQGEFAGYLGVNIDIQELKEAQQAAQRRAAELEAVIESIGDGVAIYDAEGHMLQTNSALRALLQYTEAEIELPAAARVRLLDPRDVTGRPICEDEYPIVRALRGEAFAGFAMTIYGGTEREATTLYSCAPLRGPDGGIIGVVATTTDVTEMQRLQQEAQRLAAEAQQRAELLDTTISSMADAVIVIDLAGNLLRTNPAFRAMMDYTEGDVSLPLAERFARLEATDGDGLPLNADATPGLRALHGETVGGFPMRFRDLRGRTIEVTVSAAPLRDAGGAVVAAVVALTDITELRHVQREAQRLAAELDTTFESIADGVMIYDADGFLLRSNATMRALLQYTEAESRLPLDDRLKVLDLRDIEGRPVAPDAAPAARALRGETVVGVTMTMYLGTEREATSLYSGAPLRGSDGAVVGAVVTVTDITAMQRLQQETQRLATESQRRAAELDTIINSIADAVSISDARGRLVRVNEAARRMLRYEHHEVESYEQRTQRCIYRHADGTEFAFEDLPLTRSLRGEIVTAETVEMLWPDGGSTWVTSSSAPLRNAEGAIVGGVLTNTDVTAMRQAEEALRESEERLRAAANAAHFGTFNVDIINERTYWSPEYREIVGMTPDEPPDPPRDVPRFIHPDDVGIASEMVRRAMNPAGDGNISAEYRIVRPDGTVRWVQVQGQVSFEGGAESRHPVRANGTMMDITQRKQAEEEAQASRAVLESALASIRDAVFISDIEGNFVEFNDAFATYHRFGSREECSDSISDCAEQLEVHFADGTLAAPDVWAVPRALRGESVAYTEYVLRRRDTGETWWGSYSFGPIRDSDGEIIGSVVVARDITERKQVEEELRRHRDELEELVAERTAELTESETKYRELVGGANSAIMRLDPTGKILFVNPHLEELFGYDPGELVGQPAAVLVAPNPQPGKTAEGMVQDIAADPDAYRVNLNEKVTKDGRRLWMLWSNRATHDEHGEVTGWLTVGTDQTAQHEAEQKLREHQERLQVLAEEARQRAEELAESEHKYRELVENARSAIIQYDRDGTMTLVNEYTEELFGYEPGELLGKSVMMLVPAVEEGTGRNLEGLKDAVVAAPVAYSTSENETITKDGRRLWTVWTNRALYDEHGNYTGIMCIGIDRTAQHEAQKELRANQEQLRQVAAELALAEQRERQRIATGLHDDISQTLVYAKMKLQQTVWLERPEELAVARRELLGLLDEAIRDTRDLIYQLSTPILFQEGLAEAIIWAAARAGEQYGMEVAVEVQGDARRMPEDMEVTVFQAVKELLNNARKYAAGAPVTVRVEFGESELRVQVTDCGGGFDPDRVGVRSDGGFGLLNIHERLTYIGGKLAIESGPERGTQCTLAVPVAWRWGE